MNSKSNSIAYTVEILDFEPLNGEAACCSKTDTILNTTVNVEILSIGAAENWVYDQDYIGLLIEDAIPVTLLLDLGTGSVENEVHLAFS